MERSKGCSRNHGVGRTIIKYALAQTAMTADPHYVILDKNFLQKENQETPRLRALAIAGCELVLIDTVIYEICSDKQIAQLWEVIQKKLRPFAEHVHVWMHTSEMNRWEIMNRRPISGPQAVETTELMRRLLRDSCGLKNSKLHSIVAEAHQEREVNTVKKLVKASRSLGKIIRERLERKQIVANDESIGSLILRQLDDIELIQWLAKNSYGDKAKSETYFPEARNITPNWFIFQSLRVNLALMSIYIQKYGLIERPGEKIPKKLPNTKLDADYLAALHYADALASDETTGDMSKLLKALQPGKKQITSNKLLDANLTKEEIRLRAFYRWQAAGRSHGNDLSDWLASESELIQTFWREL